MRTTTLLLLQMATLVSCFAPHGTKHLYNSRTLAMPPLYMSDVPTEDWKDVLYSKLPPSPEDQLIMTGDVVALFVYSFLDHTLNEQYVTECLQGNAQYLDPLGELSAHQVPVWFDALHSTISSDYILSILNLPQVYYSPIIGTSGAASVVLTSGWLVSGWYSGAFLFRNTVECHTSQALIKTFQTWMTTCALVMGVAFLTNQYVFDIMPGISKADADYIFDSLTVLLTWRFLVSAMLGYGK